MPLNLHHPWEAIEKRDVETFDDIGEQHESFKAFKGARRVIAAVLNLLENPDLAERMGKRARELALERHSLGGTSRIRIQCYEELMRATLS